MRYLGPVVSEWPVLGYLDPMLECSTLKTPYCLVPSRDVEIVPYEYYHLRQTPGLRLIWALPSGWLASHGLA